MKLPPDVASTDGLPQGPVWLSYPLSPETPAYGDGEGLDVEPLTSVAGGATANTVRLTLPNHLGTHVDAPRHFFDAGGDLTSYPPEHWVFERPVLVDVKVASGDLVGPEPFTEVGTDADLVLIRTGHGQARGTPPYWQGGPGLSPELGLWLRANRPNVRAVGMDLISVTSRLQREAGRAAHRAFLDPDGPGQPILLIEDMNLVACPEDLCWVLVSPLQLEGGDGAPVTVWAYGDGQ